MEHKAGNDLYKDEVRVHNLPPYMHVTVVVVQEEENLQCTASVVLRWIMWLQNAGECLVR